MAPKLDEAYWLDRAKQTRIQAERLTTSHAKQALPGSAAAYGRNSGERARQLIDGASYGPEALKSLGQAFDAAWLEIAGNFGDDPRDIEAARLRLAKALLLIADED